MKIPTHIQQAIQAYYAERATPEDIAELEAWFRADEANVRLFAELGLIEWQTLCATEKADAAAILAVLREAEQNSDPDFSLLQARVFEKTTSKADPDAISAHDLAVVGGYAIRLVLRSKFAKRIYAFSGVAAVLLLAFVLFNPWANNETPNDTPFASDNSKKPAASTESTPRGSDPVATLTAQHDAVWDAASAEGALAPGSPLRAGQHLTLTAGFAEITTEEGAVVILQAPATVELLDHNNAIHLHTGKLVGICETDSSKGFLVRTPHMDITDLGTEFGVQVNTSRVTATVMSGEIELNTPGGTPTPLTANQTAHLDIDGFDRTLVIEDRLAHGFTTVAHVFRPSMALRNDPAMIAYYGLDAQDIVNGKLLNRAQATLGKMDGVLGQQGRPDSAPMLTEGRRPGTNALRFEAKEYDLVRIPAEYAKTLDGLEQFTIGLWVRPDNTDQFSHHLVTWREQNQDAINLVSVWNGSPNALNDGALPDAALFSSSRITSRINAHQSSAGSLRRERQWMHLVVTFDRGERSIYLDGKQIAELASSGPRAIVGVNEDLLIGAAMPFINDPSSYLDGDLDELFILGRVMSPDEIAALYETEVAQP